MPVNTVILTAPNAKKSDQANMAAHLTGHASVASAFDAKLVHGICGRDNFE
jgi:hypothetical protein